MIVTEPGVVGVIKAQGRLIPGVFPFRKCRFIEGASGAGPEVDLGRKGGLLLYIIAWNRIGTPSNCLISFW